MSLTPLSPEKTGRFQSRERFHCDCMAADTLAAMGKKRGDVFCNTVSDGAMISVKEGQCALLTAQSRIAELCAQPGDYCFSLYSQPSLLTGSLCSADLAESLSMIEKHASSAAPVTEQKLYYIRTTPIKTDTLRGRRTSPFRHQERENGIDLTVSLHYSYEYSYRIADPVCFFTSVCGCVGADYVRDSFEMLIRPDIEQALETVFMEYGDREVPYDSLPERSEQISDRVKERCGASLKERYGTELLSVSLRQSIISAEDEEMLRKVRCMAAMRDPSVAAQTILLQQQEALRLSKLGEAYRQSKGPSPAYEAAKSRAEAHAAKPVAWTCACGTTGTGRFCTECGAKRPESWSCPSCGKTGNRGKFCENCGTARG